MKNQLTYTQDDRDFAAQLFSKLDMHWGGDTIGMVRPGYSKQEREAHALIAQTGHSFGLPVFIDVAGGTHLVLQGKNPDAPALMMGSHLDAVPQGGRYDGPAGVISPLIAMRSLRDRGIVPPQDIVLTIFPCEESPRFNLALLGSKLMTAMTSSKTVFNTCAAGTDVPLAEHMRAIGLDPEALVQRLEKGEASIPLNSIGAFVETHIEQANVLTKRGREIGIVTGIRGHARFPKQIVFHGEPGHTGATPQDERVDAVRMGSAFINTISSALQTQYIAKGKDLVYAFVRANTPVNASPTSVSDQFAVQMEIRSIDREVIHYATNLIIKIAQMEARNHHGKVTLNDNDIIIGNPEEMDAELINMVDTLAQEIDIKPLRMPSGAGHDASTMMSVRVPSTMIFIAHGAKGRSHVPWETMSLNEGDDPVGVLSPFAKATLLNARLMMEPIRHNARQTQGGFKDALMQCGAQLVMR